MKHDDVKPDLVYKKWGHLTPTPVLKNNFVLIIIHDIISTDTKLLVNLEGIISVTENCGNRGSLQFCVEWSFGFIPFNDFHKT